MAEIPVAPVGGGSILSGPVKPLASQAAFQNTALSSLGAGFDRLGAGLSTFEAARKREEERRRKEAEAAAEKEKQKNDALWLNQALSQYHRRLTDFEIDPNNRSSEGFLKSFLEDANMGMDELLANAPSEEAALMLQEKAISMQDSRYPRVASVTAENELRNDLVALEEGWGTSLSSFHKMSAVDPDAAAGDLIDNLATGAESIFMMYGDIAPDQANKMVAQRAEDTILALMDSKPAIAEDLLNNTPYLSEATRETLRGKLERAKSTTNYEIQDNFNTVRSEVGLAAMQGKPFVPIAQEEYTAIYGKDRGTAEYNQDQRKIEAANKSWQFAETLTGLIPQAQMAAAEKYTETLVSPEDQAAFREIVVSKIQESARQYEEGDTQWLYDNNDVIQRKKKDLEAIEAVDPNSQQAIDKKTELYDTLLDMQKFGTDGYHMNRFPNERHLLSKNQATMFVKQINSAPIDQAVGVINSILQQFPEDRHRAVVMNDLSVLSAEKISPTIKIAFENANQPWMPQFVGAVKAIESAGGVADIQKREVKTAVESSGLWNAFTGSSMGPEFQNVDQLSEYRQAIETFAHAKVLGGMEPEEAVNTAVNQILGSTMTPATVRRPYRRKDDQMIWIPKEQYGRRVDDDYIASQARRMGDALSSINPDDVDPEQFPEYNLNDDHKRRMLTHKQIVDTATYVYNPSDSSYLVMVERKDGGKVALRNKEGKFFKLHLNKIPSFVGKGLFGQSVITGRNPKAGNQDTDFLETGKFWDFEE